jgi:hypothetical protein
MLADLPAFGGRRFLLRSASTLAALEFAKSAYYNISLIRQRPPRNCGLQFLFFANLVSNCRNIWLRRGLLETSIHGHRKESAVPSCGTTIRPRRTCLQPLAHSSQAFQPGLVSQFGPPSSITIALIVACLTSPSS